MRCTYLALTANAVVHVPALGELEREKDVRVCVNNLIKANDVRVLQLFHRLDLSLDFFLHAKLANFVLVQNFEGYWFVNCLVYSHCDELNALTLTLQIDLDLRFTLPYAPSPRVRPIL